MADSDKITDKAVDFASQAAAAAAPLVDKATELAGQARKGAAESVSAIAESLDNVTGGVFADQISSVSNRIEEKLEP